MRSQRLCAGLIVIPWLLAIGPGRGEEPSPELKEKIGGAIRSEIEGAASIENTGARALVLRILGQTQARLGDRERARATLKQALKEALDAFEGESGDVASLCAVAKLLGELGEQSESRAGFRKALEAAEKAEHHSLKFKERADSEDFGRSLKSDALVRVATAQAKAGDADLARETFTRVLALIETVKDERKAINELCEVGQARRKAGDLEGADETFEQAIRMAEALKSEPEKEGELPVLPEPPQFPKPGEELVMPKFPDRRTPREVLRDIIIARLEAGDFDGASKALENTAIKGKFDGWDLARIAGALKAEHRDGATRFLDRLRKLADGYGKAGGIDRSRTLEGIAKAEARLGLIDEASRTAEEIGRGAAFPQLFREMRLKALLAIARAEVRAGAAGSARKRLREAFELATEESKVRDRLSLMPSEAGLEAIAKAQARAGDLEGAERSMAALPEIEEKPGEAGKEDTERFTRDMFRLRRGDTLVALAAAQSRAGDRSAAQKTFRKALEIAGAFKDRFDGRRLYQTIANAQAAAGDLDAALQTIESIDPDMRDLAVVVLIDERLKDRDVAAAHRLADGLDNLREASLVRIATVEAEAGDPSEVLRWATRLDSAVGRAQALANLVRGLNHLGGHEDPPEPADDDPLNLDFARPDTLPGLPGNEEEP